MDYSMYGGDDENLELKRLNAEVLERPDEVEAWEDLVRAVEGLDGGLHRNSSPQAIATFRDVYDRFLAKYPLFFGYWKKYAGMEFSIGGTEAAELIYERGVASISTSVDLWAQYCAFKSETTHDPEPIRELFERAAGCVGFDFLAHPFWDKYMEWEDRNEQADRIFAILSRVIHIPLHQYARYFERFRQLAQSQPLSELAPAETLTQLQQEITTETTGDNPPSEQEMEREVRSRIDNYHLEIFQKCQMETTKRWTYEQEIKRPYFHIPALDEAQLENWRKYLDFEEAEGDYERIVFLYERCLVTAAYYDEFWSRFARWMQGQADKTEEVRNIYQRASSIFIPIARPQIRLQWALFEEMNDRVDVALAIYEAILFALPGDIETIIAWANCARRHHGVDAAVTVYKDHISPDRHDIHPYVKPDLVAEWARLIYKVKGSAAEAREIFKSNQQNCLDSHHFWKEYLAFEMEQPTSTAEEGTNHARIKQVVVDARSTGRLQPGVQASLVHTYMVYLLERGTEGVAKEYMELAREISL